MTPNLNRIEYDIIQDEQLCLTLLELWRCKDRNNAVMGQTNVMIHKGLLTNMLDEIGVYVNINMYLTQVLLICGNHTPLYMMILLKDLFDKCKELHGDSIFSHSLYPYEITLDDYYKTFGVDGIKLFPFIRIDELSDVKESDDLSNRLQKYVNITSNYIKKLDAQKDPVTGNDLIYQSVFW